LRDFNPDILLLHARQASLGVGHPVININNHPFTNDNQSLCLIHNGRIFEFNVLRKNFQVLSECDSEIILRIIEAEQDRTVGIANVFSLINYGHMAVALGEIVADKKTLWLFRNRHRSLWVIDLREELGQIFFCSTANIWAHAVCSLNFKKQKLIEVPTEEVWRFESDGGFNSYDVQFDGDLQEWNNSDYFPVQRSTEQGREIQIIFEELKTLIFKEPNRRSKTQLTSIVRVEFDNLMSELYGRYSK